MKVGDYVRTKDGKISKIINIERSLTFAGYEEKITTDEFKYSSRDMVIIKKSSPNIIDLIEVGDYVNGFRVEDVYNPEGTYVLWLTLSCNPIDRWKNEDIKSIVTKEQFENCMYKIGE